MALKPGGTCRISPVSAAAASCRAASVTAAAEVSATVSPSASSVSVAWPSRIVAEYSFSVSARWPSSLVALSTPITSTPVAIGSSVPACPTRRVRARRRIRPTTSCEVRRGGLSTMTRPPVLTRGDDPPDPSAARRSPDPPGVTGLRPPAPPARELLPQRGHDLGGRAAGGEPGRQGVPAAAERDARAPDVHLALGPGRYLPVPGVVLFEHDRHVGLVGPAYHIDDRFADLERQAAREPVTAGHGGPHQPVTARAVRFEPRSIQHRGQQAEKPERGPVPELMRDHPRLDAGLQQPCRQPVHRGRCR